MERHIPDPTPGKGVNFSELVRAAVEPNTPKKIITQTESRKEFYSPLLMVRFLVANPHTTPRAAAAHFGHPEQWFYSVLADAEFQTLVRPHKKSIRNPMLTATTEEQFQALTLNSLAVLNQRLTRDDASEDLLIKAAGLGVKAMALAVEFKQAELKLKDSQDASKGLQAPSGLNELANNLNVLLSSKKLRNAPHG